MNQTQTAWALFVAISAISGILVSGMVWMLRVLIDKGRSWIVALDDSGFATMKRRRITGVITTIKPRNSEGRAWTLDGRAKYTSNRGPLFLVHGTTGQSLLAPTADEFKADLERKAAADAAAHDPDSSRPRATSEWVNKLLACDPYYTFNVLKTNSYKKWLSTQEGKEDWRTRAIIPALLALVVVTITLGVVVYKMKGGA